MLYVNYISMKLEKMYEEKSLQDFEQGGTKCLKDHMAAVWGTEHSGPDWEECSDRLLRLSAESGRPLPTKGC